MPFGTPVAEAFVRIRPTGGAEFGRELQREVTPQVQRVERSLRASERELGRASRGAIRGSGAFGELGRSVAFASGAFIGAAGFTEAVRTSVDAAEEFGKASRGLTAQLRANNESVEAAAPLIETANQSMAKFGLTATDSEAALIRLDRATGNIRRAIQLEGLTADFAASRHISLAQAALVAGKVVQGTTTAFNRFGLVVKKGTSVQDALRLATEKFAGQAAASVTPLEKLHASVTNLEIVIGEALLPTINQAADGLAKWLNKPVNQERVRRDVKETAHAFAGLAGAVGDVVGAIKKLDSLQPDLRLPHVPGFVPGSSNKTLFGRFANPQGIVGPIGGGNLDVGLRPDDRAVGGRRNSDGTITPKTATTTPSGEPTTGIPWLDNLLARAEATAGRGDDERVLRRIQTVLRARLAKAKSLSGRTKIQQALNQFTDQLASLTEQDAQAIQDRLDAKNQRIADAADLAARRERSRISVWQDRQAELAAGRQRRADRLAARVQALTQTPAGLTLEEQIATQNAKTEKDLLPILQQERASAIKRLAIVEDLEKKKKASANDVLQAELTLATVNRRIRDIKQADKAADKGFSLTDLYAEAGNELALYGSNIGPAGAPLSRQDAHAGLATVVQSKQFAIVQHFHGERNAAQAIVEAARAAQAVR